MDNRDKEILRGCRVQLANDLTVEELWDPLVHVGLFSPNELQRINRPNSGLEYPMTRLLDALEQKGPMAFKDFKKALEHVNKPHLLEIINQCEEGKGKMADGDEHDQIFPMERNMQEKTMEMKDLLNASCKPQQDGSFTIKKENMDLLLQKVDNLITFNHGGAKSCGVCVNENIFCCGCKRLKEENQDLRRQLEKLKTESIKIMARIQKSLCNMQESSDDVEDEEIKSGDLKMGMSKLVLDIEQEKESFA